MVEGRDKLPVHCRGRFYPSEIPASILHSSLLHDVYGRNATDRDKLACLGYQRILASSLVKKVEEY